MLNESFLKQYTSIIIIPLLIIIILIISSSNISAVPGKNQPTITPDDDAIFTIISGKPLKFDTVSNESHSENNSLSALPQDKNYKIPKVDKSQPVKYEKTFPSSNRKPLKFDTVSNKPYSTVADTYDTSPPEVTPPNRTSIDSKSNLNELDESQSDLFFFTQDPYIDPEAFKDDQYIDNDQANEFLSASVTEPYTLADQDYPYSIVDHRLLDSDLDISYKYDTIFCASAHQFYEPPLDTNIKKFDTISFGPPPARSHKFDTIASAPYPKSAQLSRHNISIADYTNTAQRPTFFLSSMTAKDPYRDQVVEMVYYKRTNFKDGFDESILLRPEADRTNSGGFQKDSSGSPHGYIYNYSIRTSGFIAVWTGETQFKCKPYSSKSASQSNKSCLPASSLRPEPEPLRLIRVSNPNPCYGKPFWPQPPQKKCFKYPDTPERNTLRVGNRTLYSSGSGLPLFHC